MPSEPVPVAKLGKVVERYQAAVDDFGREIARLLGVNETDLRCLEVLIEEETEGATPRLIADRLGLTTGSVTTLLDRLEKIGYLQRSPHPTDRRRLIVHATETARRRAAELITPLIDEGNRMLTARYGVAELELISDFLVRLAELQQSHVHRLRDRKPFSRS